MKIARFILVAIAITTVGCSEADKPVKSALPDSAERVSNVQDALDATFSDSEKILLQSWNGRWIGTDCDTNVELHADGNVELTEYRYGISNYVGTYSITTAVDGTASELTMSLDGYLGTWPAMAVYTDRSEILLMPSEGSTEFTVGNRAGATVPEGAGSFWPFRQIPIPRPNG